MTGAVVSRMVTVKLSVLVVLPSLAEQTTVVLPTENVEPDGGTQETGTGPATSSVAVGSV